jgi:hypothetical protein
VGDAFCGAEPAVGGEFVFVAVDVAAGCVGGDGAVGSTGLKRRHEQPLEHLLQHVLNDLLGVLLEHVL